MFLNLLSNSEPVLSRAIRRAAYLEYGCPIRLWLSAPFTVPIGAKPFRKDRARRPTPLAGRVTQVQACPGCSRRVARRCLLRSRAPRLSDDSNVRALPEPLPVLHAVSAHSASLAVRRPIRPPLAHTPPPPPPTSCILHPL